MADGFEMRCVYMMTDENITANADKKILFGIIPSLTLVNKKKSLQPFYLWGLSGFFDSRRYVLYIIIWQISEDFLCFL